jgi:hypothetical protein
LAQMKHLMSMNLVSKNCCQFCRSTMLAVKLAANVLWLPVRVGIKSNKPI